MKIWYGYGSDHSANLVMIGEFKTAGDVERVNELIGILLEHAGLDYADGMIDHWGNNEQLSERTEKRLKELEIYHLSPADVADFALLDPSIETSGNTVRIRTDNVEIGGFIKLLVNQGAKVQVYCADHYADQEKDKDE